jgi:hypothetical protein
MKGKPWDETRNKAFIAAWERGDSGRIIRKQFNLTSYSLKRKVAKFGLTPRPSSIVRTDDPKPRSAVRAGISTLPPLPSLAEPI